MDSLPIVPHFPPKLKGNLGRTGGKRRAAKGRIAARRDRRIGDGRDTQIMLASQQAHALQGVLMLLAYSAGLGVPFVVSAVLIDSLKASFDAIKRHYVLVNTVSGLLLVAVGILMATGTIGRLLSLLS